MKKESTLREKEMQSTQAGHRICQSRRTNWGLINTYSRKNPLEKNPQIGKRASKLRNKSKMLTT